MAPFVLRVKGGEDSFFSPLENMHSEQEVSYVWRVTNKVKDALENGSRMENMSWRLWFRHQLLNQQKVEKRKQEQEKLLLEQIQLHDQQQQPPMPLQETNHHHQFWFDQQHNPPPPPTKDLPPDMMDFDDAANQFMLHNTSHDFLFDTAGMNHTMTTTNATTIKPEHAQDNTPWPLATTEYDLQRDMRDSPTSFQQDPLDNALATRMAAFSMQTMNSMPPSPTMAHMPPMSMHHRTPQDAMNDITTTSQAVYVESSNMLLQQQQSTQQPITTLDKLLEQQANHPIHHTHHHHHHHHPSARVRSRPQISLEIEGMTSSSSSSAANDHSALYHTDLFSPSIASSSQAGDVMPVPQILNLLEQAGMYDGDQPAKFEDEQQLRQHYHPHHHHPHHHPNHIEPQQVEKQQPQQLVTPSSKIRKNENDMEEDDSSSDEDESSDDDDDDTSDEEDDEEIDDTPICTNCGATSTPLWRRSPDDELLCNACGLYQKLHNAPRPKSLRPNSARKETREETAVRLVCSNCSTTTTPLWRRDGEGAPLCNACGLYLKLHHEKRPLSMKSDTIKKRQRYEGQRGRKKGKKKKDKQKKKKRSRKDDSSSKKKHREEKRGRVAYSPTPEAATLPSSPTAAIPSSSIMASTTQLMMNFQQATTTSNTSSPHQQPFYQDHLFQHTFNFTASSPSSTNNNDLCDGSCIAGMGAADF